jgi:D-threo-aldose 1-dehydrogenase
MDLPLPRVIFGSSSLGNLYQALSKDEKYGLLDEIFLRAPGKAALDSAGKYGAGLALEVLGRYLRDKAVPRDKVLISNKLGWYRVPLKTREPTFEPGLWKEIGHDAEQRIGYEGIIECWEQGCELLGSGYEPDLLSIHDPDEYLLAAGSPGERKERFRDILEATRGLFELRKKGRAAGVGMGAKDWTVIAGVLGEVRLDWIMIAGSYTVYRHPAEVVGFLDACRKKGITVVNSAVFHSGFLTGGPHFDYKPVDPGSKDGRKLVEWREGFRAVCGRHGVAPAHACVQFGLRHPAVAGIALNTTRRERVEENVRMAGTALPKEFWADLARAGFIQ